MIGAWQRDITQGQTDMRQGQKDMRQGQKDLWRYPSDPASYPSDPASYSFDPASPWVAWGAQDATEIASWAHLRHFFIASRPISDTFLELLGQTNPRKYKIVKSVKSCNTTAFWLHFVGSGGQFCTSWSKVLQFSLLTWADLALIWAVLGDFVAVLGYAAVFLPKLGGALFYSKGPPPSPLPSGYPGGGIWEGERFLTRKIIEEINPGSHFLERCQECVYKKSFLEIIFRKKYRNVSTERASGPLKRTSGFSKNQFPGPFSETSL